MLLLTQTPSNIIETEEREQEGPNSKYLQIRLTILPKLMQEKLLVGNNIQNIAEGHKEVNIEITHHHDYISQKIQQCTTNVNLQRTQYITIILSYQGKIWFNLLIERQSIRLTLYIMLLPTYMQFKIHIQEKKSRR